MQSRCICQGHLCSLVIMLGTKTLTMYGKPPCAFGLGGRGGVVCLNIRYEQREPHQWQTWPVHAWVATEWPQRTCTDYPQQDIIAWLKETLNSRRVQLHWYSSYKPHSCFEPVVVCVSQIMVWTLTKKINGVCGGPSGAQISGNKLNTFWNHCKQRLSHLTGRPHPTANRQTVWTIAPDHHLTKW